MIRPTSITLAAALTALTFTLPAAGQYGAIRGLSGAPPAYYNGYYNAGYAPAAAPAYVGYGAPAAGYYAPPTAGYYAPAYGAGYAPAYGAGGGYYAAPRGVVAGYAPPAANYAAPYGVQTAYYPAPSGYANYYAAPAAYAATTPAYRISYPAADYNARSAYQPAPPAGFPAQTYAYVPRPAQQVVLYRVTVLDPVTNQPVNCLQPVAPTPACGSSCSSSGCRLFSWFRRGGCNSGGCTTNYCAPTTCGTSNAVGGCGAAAVPYYNNVVPVNPPIGGVPVQPVQPFTPVNPVSPANPGAVRIIPRPRTFLGEDTTVPPPGTRVITPGSNLPNNTIPGTTFPGGSAIPGGTAPADTRPSLQNIPDPPNSFNSGSGASFRRDTLRPRGGDSRPSDTVILNTPSNSLNRSPARATVKPVPDPAGHNRPNPKGGSAPQLLDPRDRTALRHSGGVDVVPAVWPRSGEIATVSRRSEIRPAAAIQETSPPQVETWDDSGWSSARD